MTVSQRIGAVELSRLLGLEHPPTAEQAAVIESGMEPVAVVAGAGSGKTETMAARVVWLVANELVTPDQVLGLTFTRKAAAELGARIRRRLAQWRRVVEREFPGDSERLAVLQAQEPTVCTYAAYAGRLVSEQALRVGAEPDARLLSQAQVWQLADEVVRSWREPLPQFNTVPSLTQWVLAMAGQCADHRAAPAEVGAFCAAELAHFFELPIGGKGRSETPYGTEPYVTALRQRQAMMPLVERFLQAKRDRRAVDFGDQMTLAADLAELEPVRSAERSRFGAVLLDEYQDTGHAQVVMLAGLFGAGHPVTAVGDPFQSIYGWRGASAANMVAFDRTFPRSDGSPSAVYSLATSFRNDAAILTVSNAVAAPLRELVGTEPLRARTGAAEGRVGVCFAETVDDEAGWLARRLAAAWDGRAGAERTAAVLVRRRSQLPVLADALRAAGLPVEIVGLGGLLTTAEVVDVVATLRVLAEVKPGGSLMRLLTGARWRIGAADLRALYDRGRHLARGARPPAAAEPRAEGEREQSGESPAEPAAQPAEYEDVSLIEALDDLGHSGAYSAEGYRRMSGLAGELRRLRRRLLAPLAELVAEVEHTIGVGIEVESRADRAQVGRVHLDRFLDEAAAFAAEAGDASLRAFLSYLEAAEDEENGLEAGEVVVAAERVQLLTVHGAKGLEWDLVAVAGLAANLFPAVPKGTNWARARQELPGPLRGDRDAVPVLDIGGAQTRQEVGAALTAHDQAVKDRHLEEERRLAYVAMTRARSLLLVCGYAWDTTRKPRVPSAFLCDVAELVEPDGWAVIPDDAPNPCTSEPLSAPWPLDPLGSSPGQAALRRDAVEAGAALVRAAMGGASPTQVGAQSDEAADPRAASWLHDADVLLAERDLLRAGSVLAVALPETLSVSQLVELDRDPLALARRLHRPLPAEPAPWARRGTAFHAWLEQRWTMPTLLDIDELPGAADEFAADDAELVELQAAFEASPWAGRTPAHVEVPFEMAIGAAVVRGRMDAVFGDAEHGWQIVDWKTGAKPTGGAAAAAAVQLAAYRLAWARLNDIPDAALRQVRAAFHYVRSNETVEPTTLLDAAGLRALITGG